MKKIFVTIKWENGVMNGYVHEEELYGDALRLTVIDSLGKEKKMDITESDVNPQILAVRNGGIVETENYTIFVNYGNTEYEPEMHEATMNDITVKAIVKHDQKAFYEAVLGENHTVYVAVRKEDIHDGMENAEEMCSGAGWSKNERSTVGYYLRRELDDDLGHELEFLLNNEKELPMKNITLKSHTYCLDRK